jgi:hypothetical protein
MSADQPEGPGGEIVEKLIVASGVYVTAAEAEAVARSLARIRAAAAILQRSISFDDTGERYYRLLDRHAGGETPR